MMSKHAQREVKRTQKRADRSRATMLKALIGLAELQKLVNPELFEEPGAGDQRIFLNGRQYIQNERGEWKETES
jgi:hypothetical protein